ncbi:hypothetical protein OS493_033860 [Desmophyllum pertusum]|uniref:Uncharacterized protein n=1 Tax=Desmophyllum pertusum TaxID=174260 RepID=A0A9W9YM54_9CNID|nr:hypothetical protein OS493_033860 [Desmophyllum pertusum]
MENKDNFLSSIQVSKSNLAKAIMTGEKDKIDKCRKKLEDLRNEWMEMPVDECTPRNEENDDVDLTSSSSETVNDYDYGVDNSSQSVKENKKKSNPAAENKKTSSQASSKPRRKHVCPLKGCKSQVVDLPRHLREVHKWTKERAKTATSHFGMRDSFSSKVGGKRKEKKWKDYHHHRKCPIAGCHSTVRRLSHHLRQVHSDICKGS